MPVIGGLNKRLDLIKREVLREAGHPRNSVRAFREALLDRDFWEGRGERRPSFSEEAMRHYHLRRDPPASYLSAIVERFDVNPTWLLTGEPEGMMFMRQVREAQAATLDESGHPWWSMALNGVPDLAGWPTPARVLFLDVLEDYAWSFAGLELLAEHPEHRRREAIEALAADLFEMVNVNYIHGLRPLNQREFTQYLVALIHAVQLRIPERGEGIHLYQRFNTLSEEFREQMRKDLANVPDGDRIVAEMLTRPLTEISASRWEPSGA